MADADIEPRLAEIVAEGRYGPAMAALPNDRQRAFVLACNQPTQDTGQVNYADAARRAGYGTNGAPNSVHVAASRLAHDPRIQAAMLELAQAQMGAAVPMATAALIQIMSGGLKAADRMKAAGMILNRGGLPEQSEHHVVVTKTETQQDRLERAIRLAKELGLDPAAMLGKIGLTVEGRAIAQAENPIAISDQGLGDDWLR